MGSNTESENHVFPAPELAALPTRTTLAFPPPRPEGNTKLEAEYEAFVQMWPELLRSYFNQYVAIHDGRVVASGPDKILVTQQAYQKCGYVPVYVHLVTD